VQYSAINLVALLWGCFGHSLRSLVCPDRIPCNRIQSQQPKARLAGRPSA
jgi:hypothetical protein